MTDHELSRRDFLAVSLGTLVAGALPLLSNVGCGASSLQMARLIIPSLVASKIEDLLNQMADFTPSFSTRRWAGGEMMNANVVNWSGPEAPIPSERILSAFAAVAKERAMELTSPLVSPHRSQLFYCQSGLSTHFLVNGYTSAFKIHSYWLNWLLQSDTCDFMPAADSVLPSACKIDNCPVVVRRQSFSYGSGDPKTLFAVFDESTETPEALAFHKQHSKPWHGCAVHGASQVSECVDEASTK